MKFKDVLVLNENKAGYGVLEMRTSDQKRLILVCNRSGSPVYAPPYQILFASSLTLGGYSTVASSFRLSCSLESRFANETWTLRYFGPSQREQTLRIDWTITRTLSLPACNTSPNADACGKMVSMSISYFFAIISESYRNDVKQGRLLAILTTRTPMNPRLI